MSEKIHTVEHARGCCQKIFVTRMLIRDLIAVANLFVKAGASEIMTENTTHAA